MRKLRVKKIRFYLYPLLLLIILSGLIFGVPRLIKIKEITCKSQFGPCPNQILEVLSQATARDIQSSKKQLHALLKNNPLIDKYSLAFKIPAKIEVNLVTRKPYYALRNQGKYYLITKNGLVMAISQNSSLPFIEIDQDFNIGEKINTETLYALKIVSDVNSLYQINSSKFDSAGLLVELASGTKAIFPLEGDIKVLVGAFRMLYEQLNMSYEKFRIEKDVSKILIDLRYKNPVIR